MTSFISFVLSLVIFLLSGAPEVIRNQWGTPGETSDQIEQPERFFRIKVVDDLYNVGQHPLYDQEGGSLIYFEGTYTHSFTDNPVPTPRYNYNQIMYRLNLKDPELFLPVPVYSVDRNKSGHGYALRREVDAREEWREILEIPFFAYAPDRCPEGCIPVYAAKVRGKIRLTVNKPANRENNIQPLFYGKPEGKALPMEVPLYEFRDQQGVYHYSTEVELSGWERSEKPVCQVWKNPSSVLMLDTGVKPVDR